MTTRHDDELDDYIGSQEAFTPVTPTVKVQDEADLPILEKLLRTLDTDIAKLDSIDALSIKEDDFKLKEQVAINQSIKAYLVDYRDTVKQVIEEIREVMNG